MSKQDRLAPYRDDLAGAERNAAKNIVLRGEKIPLALGLVGVVLSLFLPHSGKVLGLDVLFYSDTARAFITTYPERIYVWLALVGAVLLAAATLITRNSLIALLAWFVSGAAMFYSVFAIWMRQSRPPTEPGVGPSFGLVLGAISVAAVAISLSFVVFRRSNFQKALEFARREEQTKDLIAEEQLRILAAEHRKVEENPLLQDNRRKRRK